MAALVICYECNATTVTGSFGNKCADNGNLQFYSLLNVLCMYYICEK